MKLADKLAFPLPHENHEHRHHGMTLREHYAGLAMQGLASDPDQWIYDKFQNLDATELAYAAILAADSLIALLEANPKAP